MLLNCAAVSIPLILGAGREDPRSDQADQDLERGPPEELPLAVPAAMFGIVTTPARDITRPKHVHQADA